MKRIVLLLAILSLPLWATWQNPTPVYVGPGDQTVDVVISDGEGGAAVIWRDDLTEWNYMQVIDSAGNLKWDADGVPIIANASLSTQNPDVFLDADGNYWVALEGNEDIYVQKLSPAGQRLFGDDGVAVCTAEGEQRNPVICYSKDAGIVVWGDLRTSPSHSYTQRIDDNGYIKWVEGGALLADPDYSGYAKIIPDNHGGAFYIFRRLIDTDNYIAGQRMDSLGTRMWGDSGKLYVKGTMAAQFGFIHGYMVADDSGGFVFFYDEGDYYRANRADSFGNLLWDTSSVLLGRNHDDYYGSVSPLFSDAFYVVRGTEYAVSSERVYAHRLTLNGGTPWGDTGKVVWQVWSYNPRDYIIPVVTEDGIIAWRDAWDDAPPGEGYEDRGILAQRIDTMGNSHWTEEVLICGTSGYNPRIVSTNDKAGIIVWQDTRKGNLDLYSTKIDSLGTLPPGIEENPYLPVLPLALQIVGSNLTQGSTRIRLSLSKDAFVEARVYDVVGRRVEDLTNQHLSGGEHNLVWQGNDDVGLRCPSGIYFIRVAALGAAVTEKVVLTR